MPSSLPGLLAAHPPAGAGPGGWVRPGHGLPARCECSAQDRAVLCHRKRFVAVPEGIPTETRLLDLGKNRIKTLNQTSLPASRTWRSWSSTRTS